MIFCKNINFEKIALNPNIYRNMAEKWPQNHRKPFFNIYMMFGQHFKHFFKNRKKSIFKIFFGFASTKLAEF